MSEEPATSAAIEPSSWDQLKAIVEKQDKYEYVLLGLICIVFSYFFVTYRYAMRARTLVYRRAYMNEYDE